MGNTGVRDRDGTAHLLTQALALEGKVVVSRIIPPQAQSIAAAPEVNVDYFRVRLDPEKSGTTDKVLLFDKYKPEKAVLVAPHLHD